MVPMAKKKIAGGADYIIPIAVVIAGLYLWNKVSGIFSEGSSSNPSNVPGMANLTAQGQSNSTADTNIENYVASDAYTNGQSCFTSYLYQQNPGNATITQDQAQSLFDAIDNQISIWPWNCNDFGPVLTAFQGLAANQTDISFVSTLVTGGPDLLNWIRSEFETPCSSGDGAANPVNIWNFVTWATGLPVS
jgi:hypothetical protein